MSFMGRRPTMAVWPWPCATLTSLDGRPLRAGKYIHEDDLPGELTRALTAQAWAVACAALLDWDGDPRAFGGETRNIADLPAPADLAADLISASQNWPTGPGGGAR